MKTNVRPFGYLFAKLPLLVGLVLLAGGSARVAVAESQVGLVSEGMSFQEVMRLLGAPDEKHEFEVKREDVWVYRDVEVRFKEGQVASTIYRASAADASSDSEDLSLLDLGSEDGADDSVAVEDILEEIMEGSDEGESKPK